MIKWVSVLGFLLMAISSGGLAQQPDNGDNIPIMGYKNFAYNFNLSYGSIGIMNNYQPDSIVSWPTHKHYQKFGFGLGLIFEKWDLELSFKLLYEYAQSTHPINDARLTSFYASAGYNLTPKKERLRWDLRLGLGVNPGNLIYNGNGSGGVKLKQIFFANRLETQLAWKVLNKNPGVHFNPALRLGIMWSYVKAQKSPHFDLEFYPNWPLHYYVSLVLNFGFKEQVPLNPGIKKIMKDF